MDTLGLKRAKLGQGVMSGHVAVFCCRGRPGKTKRFFGDDAPKAIKRGINMNPSGKISYFFGDEK